ncbi:uncharacterized protein METZ01_LOCUS398854, partial [marine metagenome]
MGVRVFQLLLALMLGFPFSVSAALVTQHDAIPVLLRRCVMCHGQDAQEGGLDLRTKSSMLKGQAFVSGKPNESAMIKRITSRQCPPDKNISMAGIERMSGRELQTLRDWIAAGAPEVQQKLKPIKIDPAAQKHWAFQPPRRPEVPTHKASLLMRNPIDSFLLAKLETKGLGFSVEADKLTLLRRVTYDLTGLPPTLAEMKAFVKDETPGAWDRVVDRLLASPAYGVRWGRHWMDMAGYADSE